MGALSRNYKGIEIMSYKGNHGSHVHMFTLPNGQNCSAGHYDYAKKRINKYLKEGK